MAKINLEKISKEQLEQERNPNYKYFDAPELRYKDGTSMRKYNSSKLQTIEMENKQTVTAVEWLLATLEQNSIIDLDSVDSNKYYDIIEQAKQMEKQQIIDAYDKNKMGRVNYGEKYYKESYGKE